jgi:hypothetical protein
MAGKVDGNVNHAFIIRSGLKVPTPEIPMPDLAVPYAAPIAKSELIFESVIFVDIIKKGSEGDVHPKIIF